MDALPPAGRFDAEALLAEGRALRALARSLLAAEDADDLVQETWLAALRRPAAPQRLGPWLNGAMQKLAAKWNRRRVRQQRREQAVARPELQVGLDPAALAAQTETARVLVAAVHELEEPFRTTVVLRFWHGLLPAAIAHQLDIPGNTVRSRLQRGLQRLRERLDDRAGGREGWASALPGLWPPTPAAKVVLPNILLAAATLVMNAKLLFGAILAVAVAAWFALSRPAVDPTTIAQRGEAVANAERSRPDATGRGPDLVRELAAAVADERATPAQGQPVPVPPARPWPLRVLVQDPADQPIEQATVRVWAARLELRHGQPSYGGEKGELLATLQTDAIGRAESSVVGDCVIVRAERSVAMTTEHAVWAEFATADEPPTTVLRLRQPATVRGRVLRHDGTPAVAALVTASGKGIDTRSMGSPPAAEPVRTDADGRFALQLVRDFEYAVQAAVGDAKTFAIQCSTRILPVADVLLTFPGAITARGIVVDSHGTPMVGASVRLWSEPAADRPAAAADDAEQRWLRTDADGRFRTDLQRHARYGMLASADGHPPSAIVWLEPSLERAHVEAKLVLPRFAAITGFVRTFDGKPLAGAGVHASSGPLDMAALPGPSRRECFTTGGAVRTDADGRFALAVHPGTAWTVVVTPRPESPLQFLRRAGIAPDTRDLAIVLSAAELSGCRITGSVTTPTGEPGPSCEMSIEYLDEVVIAPPHQPLPASWDGARFELPALGIERRIAIDVGPGAGSAFAPQRLGPITTTAAGAHLDIRLQPFATVVVRVVGDGQSVQGLRVQVAPRLVVAGWQGSAGIVDADGMVRLARRCPGPNELSVIDERREVDDPRQRVILRQAVDLLPGGNPEIVVRVPAAGATAR